MAKRRSKPRNGSAAGPAPPAPARAVVLNLTTTRPPREPVIIDGTRYELRWRDELDPRHALRADALSPRMQPLAARLEAGAPLTADEAAELIAGVREMAGYVLTAPPEVLERLTDTQCLAIIGRYGQLQEQRDRRGNPAPPAQDVGGLTRKGL